MRRRNKLLCVCAKLLCKLVFVAKLILFIVDLADNSYKEDVRRTTQA